LDVHGSWNIGRLQKYFRPIDVEAIIKIRPSPRLQNEFLAWHPEKSGSFTVRSAYHLAVSDHILKYAGGAASSRPDGRRPVWNLVWKSTLPQKMKIFAWKVVTGALATYANMQRRHLETVSTCRLCGLTEEDSYHALVLCPTAMKIWECMGEVWPIPATTSIQHTGQEWLFDLLSSVSKDAMNMIIMVTWRIWQLRNDVLHGKVCPPTEVTKRYQIRQQSVSEIIKGKKPCVNTVRPACETRKAPSSPWPRPAPGWAALSVDGSFDEKGRAGTGMILRGSNSAVIVSACRVLYNCNDALESEVSALMEGLALAYEWSELPIIIQSDCVVALSALKESGRNRTVYGQLFDEVKRLMNLREIILVKLDRDQNRVAHSLANLGRGGDCTACWVRFAPECVSQLLLADCNSILE
jgi:hypothetical protein